MSKSFTSQPRTKLRYTFDGALLGRVVDTADTQHVQIMSSHRPGMSSRATPNATRADGWQLIKAATAMRVHFDTSSRADTRRRQDDRS